MINEDLTFVTEAVIGFTQTLRDAIGATEDLGQTTESTGWNKSDGGRDHRKPPPSSSLSSWVCSRFCVLQ